MKLNDMKMHVDVIARFVSEEAENDAQRAAIVSVVSLAYSFLANQQRIADALEELATTVESGQQGYALPHLRTKP